jgi:hypothetical protein
MNTCWLRIASSTKRETTKERTTFCSSPPLLQLSVLDSGFQVADPPRRLTSVLQPRRMNILTKRAPLHGLPVKEPRAPLVDLS